MIVTCQILPSYPTPVIRNHNNLCLCGQEIDPRPHTVGPVSIV